MENFIWVYSSVNINICRDKIDRKIVWDICFEVRCFKKYVLGICVELCVEESDFWFGDVWKGGLDEVFFVICKRIWEVKKRKKYVTER